MRAVVAESFERIHRTNLVGVGVLPLELEPGVSRETLGLDGSEVFTITGAGGTPQPGSWMILQIRHADGRLAAVRLKCRIDTSEEAQVFAAGGLLPRIAEEFLRASPTSSDSSPQATSRQ